MMTVGEFVRANLDMLKRERAERFIGPMAYRLDRDGVPQALFFSRHQAEAIIDKAPPADAQRWQIVELYKRAP